MTYDEIKKRHKLLDKDFAAAFNLSPDSFKNSSALPRYRETVENLYYLFFNHG